MKNFIGIICAIIILSLMLLTKSLFHTPDFVIGVCVASAFFGGRDGYVEFIEAVK